MSSERRTLLIGLVLFLALALFVSGLSPIAPHRLETNLQLAATEALDHRQFRWANVSVNGQVATLSGLWPDEATHTAALDALWSAEWSGGWLAGGITRIDDNTEAQPGEAESRIVAISTSEGMSLTGIAPSDAARTGLLQRIRPLFRGRMEPRLAARSGTGNSDGWLEAAGIVLTGLETLDQGAAILNSDSAVLYGILDDATAAQGVFATLMDIPGPHRSTALILTSSGVVGGAENAEQCELLLDAAFAMGRLRFNPGSDALSPSGIVALEHIAAVVESCPDSNLQISVRPVVGGDDRAVGLAENRAQSVKSALMNYGVAEDRMGTIVNADQDQLVWLLLDAEGED